MMFAIGVIVGIGVTRLIYYFGGEKVYSMAELNAACEAAKEEGIEIGREMDDFYDHQHP